MSAMLPVAAVAGAGIGAWQFGVVGSVLGLLAGVAAMLLAIGVTGGLAFLADRRSKRKP